MRPTATTRTGIYVHVPFCRKRCPYCAFNTYDSGFELIPRWVEGVLRELDLRLAAWPCAPVDAATLYFGGGTPSLLEPEQVARVVEGVRQRVRLRPDAEVTLEINPGTVDRGRLEGFRAAGVNRATVGVQSFDDEILVKIGRDHGADAARRTVATLREVGFDNLNLDLMFALPGQDQRLWAASVDEALAFGPEHLSLYNLTVEEGTPFAALHREGQLDLPAEDVQRAMLLSARERCAAAGLHAYEVSNFARPGSEARHNSLYWTGEPYFGLGPGAHGFEPGGGAGDETIGFGRRWWDLRSPRRWLAALDRAEVPEDGSELLDARAAADEALLLGLRMALGLDLDTLGRRFGDEFVARIRKAARSPALQDHLHLSENRLTICEGSVPVMDAVITRLAAQVDRSHRSARTGKPFGRTPSPTE